MSLNNIEKIIELEKEMDKLHNALFLYTASIAFGQEESIEHIKQNFKDLNFKYLDLKDDFYET